MGEKGNEQTDRLAGMASVKNGWAMDQADILNAPKDTGCIRDSDYNCESEAMDRLSAISNRVWSDKNAM